MTYLDRSKIDDLKEEVLKI